MRGPVIAITSGNCDSFTNILLINVVKSIERQQRREARVKPVRQCYVDFLCAGPEEFDKALARCNETFKRHLLTVAYQISRVAADQRKKEFQKIMTDINEAIREEVEHDGCSVPSMVSTADAIEKNREAILYLAESIQQRIQTARDQMVSAGFCEFHGGNSDAIFRNLVPHNPDALQEGCSLPQRAQGTAAVIRDGVFLFRTSKA